MLYRGGTKANSGSSAPDRRGFFVPPTVVSSPRVWRVDKAEYNTRKGNKLGRLFAVVETRRLINAVNPLNKQEVPP